MYFQHHLARLDIASIFRVNAPTNEEGRTQVLILRVVMYFKHYLAELGLVPIFRANAPMNGEGRPQVLILPVVMYFKHYWAELGLVPILCVIVPTNVGPPAIPERAKACTMHTRESTALLLQTFLFLCTNVSSEQNPSLLIKRFISQIKKKKYFCFFPR